MSWIRNTDFRVAAAMASAKQQERSIAAEGTTNLSGRLSVHHHSTPSHHHSPGGGGGGGGVRDMMQAVRDSVAAYAFHGLPPHPI